MIAILLASALASQSASNRMVEEFGLLCASGQPSADAIRRRASQDGWRRTEAQADLTKDSDQGLLVLKVSDDQSAGETREVCSVGTASVIPNTIQAAQAVLGFKPALDLGTSATFFAVRYRGGWQSGAALSQTAFREAKKEGRFYSLTASTGDHSSLMMALHVMAASAGDAQERPAAAAATAILQHLDLNSFPNSTGPRRQRLLHTPADYGLTKLESFDDGWVQVSQPDEGWYMSALLLEGSSAAGAICFLDTGGKGIRYRATQVLHVQSHTNARWTAVQVADRPDCRNDPPMKTGVQAPDDPHAAATFIPHHTMPVPH